MKALKNNVNEFKKTAQESHSLNQRLTSIYEDMGHILNRYYDIREEMQEPVVREDVPTQDYHRNRTSVEEDLKSSTM